MAALEPVTATDLVALCRAAADQFGDRDAYVELDRRMTFAQYDAAADGVANLFAQQGLRHGQVVAILIGSSIDYAVCYQAAARLGAITSGINPRLGDADKLHILTALEAAVVIATDDGTVPQGPWKVVRVADVRAAFFTGAAAPEPTQKIRPDDPVAVVWTSGSTGRPKGAVYDHNRLAAMARGAWPMSQPGDRRLAPLPFAHTAYMTRAWDEISNGITAVLTPVDWTAASTLELIERESVTVGQGVPTQWSLMLAHPDLAHRDVSSLRIAAMGGSDVRPELVHAVTAAFGCPVVVRYTSTEACVTTTTRPDDPVERVTETVGAAVHGIELVVTDAEGNTTEAGTIGTIKCRSDAVMRGYWRDPELTATVLDDAGWLTTGDLGWLDEAGYLHLVGRRTDMYIRGGYNIYPTAIENVLSTHRLVQEVAVHPVPDDILGEIGVAVVVPTDVAEPPTLADLRAWCAGKTADYARPDRLVLVTEIPRTSMGKLDRPALTALLKDELAALSGG